MLKKALWAAVALTASLNVLAAPAIPVITSPSSEATNVERAPAFTADNIPGNANTQWLVYPEVAGHQYLGGQNGTSGLTDFGNIYQDIPYTLATTIDGKTATTLRVYPYGKAQLLAEDNEDNTVLAQATIQPDALGNIQPAREDALIAVRTFPDAMVVNWYLKDLNGSVNWDTSVQGVFASNGEVGIKSGINDWDNEFFTLNSGSVGCDVYGGGSWSGNLASVKTFLTDNSVGKFSLLCEPNNGTTGLAVYASAALTNVVLPQNTSLSSNTNTVTPDELLAASTKHIVQVRYEEAEVYSAYSAPVSFTTRAANVEWRVDAPESADLNFTAGVVKALSFTLTNDGEEAGSVVISVSLPSPLNSGNYVSNNYTASLPAGKGSCTGPNITNNTLKLSCTVTSLAPSESITATTSFPLLSGNTFIQYAVGEESKTLPVVVTASGSGSNNTNTTTTESSSSSSGGALAWPLLLLPLLMFRRYKKAA